MSADEEHDNYENSYYHFIEAVRKLAASPEECCERQGHFNVAFETKFEVEAGPYLFNYSGCPLSDEQRTGITELVKMLASVPDDVIAFTKAPSESLKRMRHPVWVPIRDHANRLLRMLKPITDQNETYFWPEGR